MNMHWFVHLIIWVSFLLASCQSPGLKSPKFLPGDPFAESIVKSQFFEIQAQKDEVIESVKGICL